MNAAHVGDVLYVYFKVDVPSHEAWARRIRQFQAQMVAQWPGLEAELLQRPEATAGKETWMEIYRHSRGLNDAMVAAIAGAAADAGLPQPRHTERFTPLR